MNRSKIFFLSMFSTLIVLFFPLNGIAAGIKEKVLLTAIRLPPGFKIELYSSEVPGARSMALSPSGVLFVGTRHTGRVYAVIKGQGDGTVDQVVTLADGLNNPNGVAFRDGDLYVAEVGRILRFRQVLSHLNKPLPPEVVYGKYPKDSRHGWKFIRFGPDGKLYVPVGAPCNVCLSDNPVFASITRMNPDGSGFEIFARGVRNTVGFDWHPKTRELWFTDNGRDWLGDDQPPDELNRADIKGRHFGFPHCHGGMLADPQFGSEQSCSQFTAPEANLGPHVAALGMRFYTGNMFPAEYRNQIFIAEHGSWNRSKKIGYRVSLVRLKNNRVVGYAPFAVGWLSGETVWGRPVDVQVMTDGSLLVSDDKNGVIYRIFYENVSPLAR